MAVQLRSGSQCHQVARQIHRPSQSEVHRGIAGHGLVNAASDAVSVVSVVSVVSAVNVVNAVSVPKGKKRSVARAGVGKRDVAAAVLAGDGEVCRRAS